MTAQQPHPACKPDTLVNGGALILALNVLRRAGKNEVADELEMTAQQPEALRLADLLESRTTPWPVKAQAAPAPQPATQELPATPPKAITAMVMQDDSRPHPAYCLMVAYRKKKDALDALAMLTEAQSAGPCAICGSDEPFTGTCGGGDPRALCQQATPKAAPKQEAQEPALFVNAKQLADLVDPSHATGGSYLPARKTRAGLFTQPLYTAPQPEPSYTAVKLAEMVLSDCGHSSNYTPLLDRVAERIDAHVQRHLDELRCCLESKPMPKPSMSHVDALDTARSLFNAGWKACAKFCARDDAIIACASKQELDAVIDAVRSQAKEGGA